MSSTATARDPDPFAPDLADKAPAEVVPQPPAPDPDLEPEPYVATGAARARRWATFRAAVASWPGFTRQATPVAEAWRLSGVVDATRIPADSQLLALLWWLDNWLSRPLLFALMQVLPAFCMGPLLYLVQRPTRRAGLWIVALVVFVVVPAVMAG